MSGTNGSSSSEIHLKVKVLVREGVRGVRVYKIENSVKKRLDLATLPHLAKDVEKVSFCMDESWGREGVTMNTTLLDFLSAASNLRRVDFHGASPGCAWSLGDVNLLLSRHIVAPQNLKSIQLGYVVGTNEQYEELGDLIKTHLHSLLNFGFWNQFRLEGPEYSLGVDPVLNALAASTKLYTMSFHGHVDLLGGESFMRLLSTPSLGHIGVFRVPVGPEATLDEENVKLSLLHGLETNSSLHTLTIDPWLGKWLSDFLRASKTLMVIGLLVRDWRNEEGYLRTLLAVLGRTSTSVRGFTIRSEHSNIRHLEKDFADMLERNYVLEDLVFDETCQLTDDLKNKVDFYTSLNKSGRCRFLRDSSFTEQQKIDVLASVNNNLGHLFYFLSNSPNLFVSAVASPSQSGIVAERNETSNKKRKRLHRAAKQGLKKGCYRY